MLAAQRWLNNPHSGQSAGGGREPVLTFYVSRWKMHLRTVPQRRVLSFVSCEYSGRRQSETSTQVGRLKEAGKIPAESWAEKSLKALPGAGKDLAVQGSPGSQEPGICWATAPETQHPGWTSFQNLGPGTSAHPPRSPGPTCAPRFPVPPTHSDKHTKNTWTHIN